MGRAPASCRATKAGRRQKISLGATAGAHPRASDPQHSVFRHELPVDADRGGRALRCCDHDELYVLRGVARDEDTPPIAPASGRRLRHGMRRPLSKTTADNRRKSPSRSTTGSAAMSIPALISKRTMSSGIASRGSGTNVMSDDLRVIISAMPADLTGGRSPRAAPRVPPLRCSSQDLPASAIRSTSRPRRRSSVGRASAAPASASAAGVTAAASPPRARMR